MSLKYSATVRKCCGMSGPSRLKAISIYDAISTVIITIVLVERIVTVFAIPDPCDELKGQHLEDCRELRVDRFTEERNERNYGLQVLLSLLVGGGALYNLILSVVLFTGAQMPNVTRTMCKIWMYINFTHAIFFTLILVIVGPIVFVTVHMTQWNKDVGIITGWLTFLYLLFVKLLVVRIVFISFVDRFNEKVWLEGFEAIVNRNESGDDKA